jgi:hypothetical protein
MVDSRSCARPMVSRRDVAYVPAARRVSSDCTCGDHQFGGLWPRMSRPRRPISSMQTAAAQIFAWLGTVTDLLVSPCDAELLDE